MDNWLSIAIGIFLLSMVLYGHYKGFICLAVSMVTLIITLVAARAVMPQVSNYIKQNTAITNTIEESIKKAAGAVIPESSDIEMSSYQRTAIENLNLPQQLKDVLIENNNNEVYEMLGVDAFVDYVTSYLSGMVLNAVVFVIILIVLYGLLRFILSWLNIVARLPILSGMNKIAGALLGGAQGLLLVWIGFLILTAMSGTAIGMLLLKQVENSAWLTFLFKYNILSKVVFGIVGSIL